MAARLAPLFVWIFGVAEDEEKRGGPSGSCEWVWAIWVAELDDVGEFLGESGLSHSLSVRCG